MQQQNTFIPEGLQEGPCKQDAQPKQEDQSKAIRNAALSLLARREYSQSELLKKLSKKYPDINLVQHQLDSLVEQGLQSDERFIAAFIRAKKAQRKGALFIRQELKNKGVSSELANIHLQSDDDEWSELAKEAYEKKYGESPISTPQEKAKRLRFMAGRGFSPSHIFPILEQASNRSSE